MSFNDMCISDVCPSIVHHQYLA